MKTKNIILLCMLWTFAALTISGCAKTPTLDDDGYQALIDLLTTERSPENNTEQDTEADTEETKDTEDTEGSSKKPSIIEEDTSDAETKSGKETAEPSTEEPSAPTFTEPVEPVSQSAAEPATTAPAPQPAAPLVYRPDYFYSSTYHTAADSLVFSPQEIYYENGSLHAIMYIYNGHATTAANIRDVYLSFDNGITAIAAAAFDSLSGCAIAPHCYVLWEFTFPAEGVFLKNTNLGSVNTTYRSSYTY